MENISDIVHKARNSLTNYCKENCKSKCCKRGALVLFDKDEVKKVCNGKQSQFQKDKILTETENGNYRFELQKIGQCPNLGEDSLCKIHNKTHYPKICHDYPLFLVKNFIIADDNCPAVKEGLLDSYIKELEKQGGLKRI